MLILPAIFGDHMVLQSGKPCFIWGWSDPGSKVRVGFADQVAESVADDEGCWRVQLMPMRASSIGTVLEICAGDTVVVLNDVVIGQVWVGSGQSNMAMRVNQTVDADRVLEKADQPELRLFTVEWNGEWVPQREMRGSWKVATPECVGDFSAVLFAFGVDLSGDLSQPVGLINASVGGSSGQAWVDQRSILEDSNLPRLQREIAETLEAYPDVVSRGAKYYGEWLREFQNYWEALQGWRAHSEDERGEMPTLTEATVVHMSTPGLFFNGMIAPISSFSIAGVLWYQGEKNANSGWAYEYRYLLRTLVDSWRSAWGDPDLPFLCVQLPEFEAPEAETWAVLRESILEVSQTVPNVWMAVSIGLGDEKDIHPPHKTPLGHRLSRLALARCYGRPVSCEGPRYRRALPESGRIRVEFELDASGIDLRSGSSTGFEVASRDGSFFPAMAQVEGESVWVWSEQVVDPLYVRYAWANCARPTLFSGSGIPASPFRTDSRKVTSQSLHG